MTRHQHGVAPSREGIRLSLQVIDDPDISFGIDSHIEAIIPMKHLVDFSNMLKEEQGETEISFGENVVLFRNEHALMQSSLIAGTYPTLDNITPNAFTTKWILQTARLRKAIKRACLLAGDSQVVTMRSNLEGVVVMTSMLEEIGEVREEIALDGWQGEPVVISCNGQYMKELLHAVDSEAIQLQFSEKWSPIIVQPIGRTNSLYILLPVRTHSYS